ncbi:MAG: hypothetical protein LBJ41_01450 [Treponema sp.]|jgi:flavodoxin|nr:hypothetical protein [Treponema sp.]
MKYAVRYFSKSGNTEKVAHAIADAIGVKVVSVDTTETVITEKMDILFLGMATYTLED